MLTVDIRIKGRIDQDWSDWFGGLTITPAAQDETVLSGMVADQAALYGLLARLRDLGLPLLCVRSAEAPPAAGSDRPANPCPAVPVAGFDKLTNDA